MTSSDQPLWQWSATRIANSIRNRDITVTEAVTAAVDQMRKVQPAINAISIDTGDAALVAAKQADEDIATGNIPTGRLFGVPVTIKHNVDVAGHNNPNGVPAMQGLIATEDSPLVERWKREGAICIGLSNVPEFSLRAFTDNPIYGQTENPWDSSITCGGSSGGAGAALAAGAGALAHGNDIGGSLRWPAYCNGVYAIRPTLGRVPAFNRSATAERSLFAQLMSVQGPMARNLDDLWLGLETMAGFDARDPWSVPAPLNGDGRDMPKRVAMIDPDEIVDLAPSVRQAMEKTRVAMEQAGYEVCVAPDGMPSLPDAADAWFDVLGAEILNTTWPLMQQVGSPKLVHALDSYFAIGNDLSLPEYIQKTADRTGMLRQWLEFLENWPVVIAPVSTLGALPPDADQAAGEDFKRIVNNLRYTLSVNYLGLPSLAMPIDLDGRKPVGVQLIGTRYREDLCFDAARAVENNLGLFNDRFGWPL